jgi:hypothetical protein
MPLAAKERKAGKALSLIRFLLASGTETLNNVGNTMNYIELFLMQLVNNLQGK